MLLNVRSDYDGLNLVERLQTAGLTPIEELLDCLSICMACVLIPNGDGKEFEEAANAFRASLIDCKWQGVQADTT